jgi:anhydro-N-acetylmuramic acid kinase
LYRHPYLAKAGPRSTGREDFNMDWLEHQLQELPGLSPVDIQATLADFTAGSIANALAAATPAVSEVYLCGGGAHNGHLTKRLATMLPTIALDSTTALGIAPDWVEAALFAWLAARTLSGLAGNAAQVTGAAGPRVLGAIYPGSN